MKIWIMPSDCMTYLKRMFPLTLSATLVHSRTLESMDFDSIRASLRVGGFIKYSI